MAVVNTQEEYNLMTGKQGNGNLENEELELDLLLLAVYRLSGFDFRKYMRSSLMRSEERRVG